jgi:DNA-binding transcriptional ArsR family regulator
MSGTPLSDPMIEEMSQLFLALGDVSRLKIIRTLQEAKSAMSQGALAQASGLSQANASKHLSQLVRVGLVTREAEGNTVFYLAVVPLVERLFEIVCGHVTGRIKSAYKAIK